MMRLTKWEQCVELSSNICNQPAGDWTHILRGQMVRFEKRVIDPSGNKLVFFRGESSGAYCGRWMADVWDKEAKRIEYGHIKRNKGAKVNEM